MAEPSAGLAISHPHLHGLLADGYWKDGAFTGFTEVDLKAIEQAFAERVLAQIHTRELDYIVTYTTKDGAAHEFGALEFLSEITQLLFRKRGPISPVLVLHVLWSASSICAG